MSAAAELSPPSSRENPAGRGAPREKLGVEAGVATRISVDKSTKGATGRFCCSADAGRLLRKQCVQGEDVLRFRIVRMGVAAEGLQRRQWVGDLRSWHMIITVVLTLCGEVGLAVTCCAELG